MLGIKINNMVSGYDKKIIWLAGTMLDIKNNNLVSGYDVGHEK